jgi:uncharacterized membrane protein YfcA
VAVFGPDAMADAVAVSFFAVLFNSLSATIENRKTRGGPAWRALVDGAKVYTLAAAAAALAVAVLFSQHRDAIAKPLLASLQLLLAVCMAIPRGWYERLRASRSGWRDMAVGALVGGVSTLIGVGGGTYTIFYFLVHGRAIKDCTLTSNFVGIFIGLMGIVGYHGVAWISPAGMHPAPPALDMLGKAVLVVAGVLASPLGVRLQSRLPAPRIRQLVVLVLAMSSSWVLLRQ